MDEQNTWSQHLQLYSDNNLVNSRSTLKMTRTTTSWKNGVENGRTKYMVWIDQHATTVTITWSRGLCSSQAKIVQRKMASGLSQRATTRLVCVLLRRTQLYFKQT